MCGVLSAGTRHQIPLACRQASKLLTLASLRSPPPRQARAQHWAVQGGAGGLPASVPLPCDVLAAIRRRQAQVAASRTLCCVERRRCHRFCQPDGSVVALQLLEDPLRLAFSHHRSVFTEGFAAESQRFPITAASLQVSFAAGPPALLGGLVARRGCGAARRAGHQGRCHNPQQPREPAPAGRQVSGVPLGMLHVCTAERGCPCCPTAKRRVAASLPVALLEEPPGAISFVLPSTLCRRYSHLKIELADIDTADIGAHLLPAFDFIEEAMAAKRGAALSRRWLPSRAWDPSHTHTPSLWPLGLASIPCSRAGALRRRRLPLRHPLHRLAHAQAQVGLQQDRHPAALPPPLPLHAALWEP